MLKSYWCTFAAFLMSYLAGADVISASPVCDHDLAKCTACTQCCSITLAPNTTWACSKYVDRECGGNDKGAGGATWHGIPDEQFHTLVLVLVLMPFLGRTNDFLINPIKSKFCPVRLRSDVHALSCAKPALANTRGLCRRVAQSSRRAWIVHLCRRSSGGRNNLESRS